MASKKHTIDLSIRTNLDQKGINDLKKSLSELYNVKPTGDRAFDKQLEKSKETINSIELALKKAYNPHLDTTSVKTFSRELKRQGMTLEGIYQDFSKMGAAGRSAYASLTQEILKSNTALKTTNKHLDKMKETMANTLRWGVTSRIFNEITDSVANAVSYVERLDKSLNNIRIVTNKSSDEMASFAKEANNAAKALGGTTIGYSDAALIYYQQGLSEEETKARAETTVKVANVTKQSTDEVSEQLTAIWNGYKVSAEEAEMYIDKVTAVAAETAADLEELATGMSKVASAANAMGVDIDQLNGMLATVVSVTRQAPESVGTAFKTIFARLSDLTIEGGVDEFGVDLGAVSGELEKVGISILDQQGNLNNVGDTIETVAAKWSTWTEAQQTSVAIAMAGKRLEYNWRWYTAMCA